MSPPSTSTVPVWMARAPEIRSNRGLADAVRSDQPDHAARRDVQADAIEGARLAVEIG